jgi:hypothetical protein
MEARFAGFDALNEVVLNQVLVSFGSPEQTRTVIAALRLEGTCWCGGTVWQNHRIKVDSAKRLSSETTSVVRGRKTRICGTTSAHRSKSSGNQVQVLTQAIGLAIRKESLKDLMGLPPDRNSACKQPATRRSQSDDTVAAVLRVGRDIKQMPAL